MYVPRNAGNFITTRKYHANTRELRGVASYKNVTDKSHKTKKKCTELI